MYLPGTALKINLYMKFKPTPATRDRQCAAARTVGRRKPIAQRDGEFIPEAPHFRSYGAQSNYSFDVRRSVPA